MVRSVRAYYNRDVETEWKRVVSTPYHRLEFETSTHFLEEHLPKSGLLLDAGGGPGRYTVELAKKGYDVVLLDIAPANLAFAKEKVRRAGQGARVKRFVKGSIEDLSMFPDEYFDAVLSLGGPLCHLVSQAARRRAIDELVRVCKGGGTILVSVIGRLGAAVTHLEILSDHIALPMFKKYALRGDYLGGYGFTAHHAYLVDELEGDFHRGDVTVLGMVGLEGVSSGHQREVNLLSRRNKLWRAWMDIHYKTCTDRSVVGMSEHMMIICRKQKSVPRLGRRLDAESLAVRCSVAQGAVDDDRVRRPH